jgi:hypothetical protein
VSPAACVAVAEDRGSGNALSNEQRDLNLQLFEPESDPGPSSATVCQTPTRPQQLLEPDTPPTVRSKFHHDDDDDRGDYEVEFIVNTRRLAVRDNGVRQFLIRWKGYGPEADTWEPEVNIQGTAEAAYELYFTFNIDKFKIIQRPIPKLQRPHPKRRRH